MKAMRRLFMRTKHRSREELITAYVDGVLDDAATAELRQAMDADPALAAEVREMQAVRGMLRSQPLAEPPRSFALPRTAAHPVPAPRPMGGLMRSLQGATAVAALLLVALVSADLSGVGTPAQPSPGSVNQLQTEMDDRADDERSEMAPEPTPVPGDSGSGGGPGITSMEDGGSAEDGNADEGQQEFGTESAPPVSENDASRTANTANEWGALEWAQVAVASLTAALALSIVGLTWGPVALRRE